MVEDGYEEPADVRRIMTWSCHGVSCLWMIVKGTNAIIILYPNPDVLRRGAIHLAVWHPIEEPWPIGPPERILPTSILSRMDT